ncbi:MAG: hypothetical protein OXI82_02155 [Nitrospinae bacterium]|nr:hypothetical protein [Nitrospinota bacterium]
MTNPVGELNDFIKSILGGVGSFVGEYPYAAGAVLLLAIILRRTIRRSRR